jgi:hypothetical protein
VGGERGVRAHKRGAGAGCSGGGGGMVEEGVGGRAGGAAVGPTGAAMRHKIPVRVWLTDWWAYYFFLPNRVGGGSFVYLRRFESEIRFPGAEAYSCPLVALRVQHCGRLRTEILVAEAGSASWVRHGRSEAEIRGGHSSCESMPVVLF